MYISITHDTVHCTVPHNVLFSIKNDTESTVILYCILTCFQREHCVLFKKCCCYCSSSSSSC